IRTERSRQIECALCCRAANLPVASPHLILTGMHEVIDFLLRYGYWVLFANVLLEQAGLPIPAIPTLLAMGALTGMGHFSLTADLALAVAACLAADPLWFHLGPTRGPPLFNFLFRLSVRTGFSPL